MDFWVGYLHSWSWVVFYLIKYLPLLPVVNDRESIFCGKDILLKLTQAIVYVRFFKEYSLTVLQSRCLVDVDL
jgi:hypothetical protein